MNANPEREHLVAWARRACASGVAWQSASTLLKGSERALALEMSEEAQSGWPKEVLRAAAAEGCGSVGDGATTVQALGWMQLALMAARDYDFAVELRRRAAAAADLEGPWATLALRVLALEAPRCAQWARALGRVAREGGAASIAEARRALDSSEVWNLGVSGSVEDDSKPD